jgi:flavin reductase (DIM6/NTAB) family NADH-FMN oxidoreductase RutF
MSAPGLGSVRPVTDPGKTFLELAGSLDYPLFIVTAAKEDRREGCIIGFATQCSFDPARFLACLSRENRTYRLGLIADALGVHLVPRARRDLAELFGGQTGDDIDKFERCAWHPGPLGVPILDDCPSWFVGRIEARLNLGDHVGFMLDPVKAQYAEGEEIVFFQAVKDAIEPGHPIT